MTLTPLFVLAWYTVHETNGIKIHAPRGGGIKTDVPLLSHSNPYRQILSKYSELSWIARDIPCSSIVLNNSYNK